MDLVSHALRAQSVLFNYRYIIQPVGSFYWAAKVCRKKMLLHIPRLSRYLQQRSFPLGLVPLIMDQPIRVDTYTFYLSLLVFLARADRSVLRERSLLTPRRIIAFSTVNVVGWIIIVRPFDPR